MIIYASDFQFLLRQVHCYTCLSIGKMLRLDYQHNEPLIDHLHRWAINYSYTSLVLLELRTQSRAIFRQQLARSHLNRKHHSCSDPLIVVSTKVRCSKLDGCRTETGAGWMRPFRPLELFSTLLAPSPPIQVSRSQILPRISLSKNCFCFHWTYQMLYQMQNPRVADSHSLKGEYLYS